MYKGMRYGRIRRDSRITKFLGRWTGATSGMDVSSRYGELDSVFLRRASQPADKDAFYSVETLLDSLMVLYQECCSSSMRRERTIAEFVESGD